MKPRIKNVPLTLERKRSRIWTANFKIIILNLIKFRKFRRLYMFLFFLFSSSLVLISLYHLSKINYTYNKNDKIFIESKNNQKYPTEEKTACRLPDLDAFDESVMKYVEMPDKIECTTEEFPLLFELDLDSTLVKLAKYEEYGFSECCYLSLTRKPKDDENVQLSKDCVPIVNRRTEIPEHVENIVIACKNNTSYEWSDVDAFYLPRLHPSLESFLKEREKKNDHMTEDKNEYLNVVILGLDGVSNLNYQRTMQLTNAYMRNNLSAVSFDGYVKLGDNTFPNLVAILTGKNEKELKETCWPSKNAHFDSCNFLWKNYSDHGYRTSLGEDAAQISAFNYFKPGFKYPPVDYYLRPSLLYQDIYIGHTEFYNAFACYGPRLAFQVLLNSMKNMAFAMNKTHPYFQFLWATSLFHDDSNIPFLLDELLLNSLTWLNNSGHLNNTVFILMSDHGMRWGDIREDTFQGKFEDRMPLLQIVFPQWFKNKYSKAISNLKSNQKMLTTHFDLHETLLDLLFLQTKVSDENIQQREMELKATVEIVRKQQQDEKKKLRGISLFLPIPKSRDCEKAGIDKHWCVCGSLKSLSVENNPVVRQAAEYIVSYINLKLKEDEKCAQLHLHKIMHAHILLVDDDLDLDLNEFSQSPKILYPNTSSNTNTSNGTLGNPGVQTYAITLKTRPGLAIFESTVMQLGNGEWSLQGDISRTNLYGKQSFCTDDSKLKKFCYCVT